MAQTDNTKTTKPTEQVELNPTPPASISMEQLAVLLKGFATEIKKPDEETQAKNEEIKQRKLAAKQAGIVAWQEEQRLIKQRQDACPHVKENGKHNIRGQIHGNGYAKALCQTCHWCSDWFEPFDEMKNGGIGFEDYGGLTRAIIDARCAELKAKLAREKAAS